MLAHSRPFHPLFFIRLLFFPNRKGGRDEIGSAQYRVLYSLLAYHHDPIIASIGYIKAYQLATQTLEPKISQAFAEPFCNSRDAKKPQYNFTP